MILLFGGVLFVLIDSCIGLLSLNYIKTKRSSTHYSSSTFDVSYSDVAQVPNILLPSSSHLPPSRGILIIDGFSQHHSGYLIDQMLHEYQIGVVRVLSPYMAEGLQRRAPPEDGTESYFQWTAPLNLEDLREWWKVLPFTLEAVICESDSGLEYAEQLACALQKNFVPRLKHNGYLPARRDKYAMNEVCRQSGISTVQQALCRNEEEAQQLAQKIFGMASTTTPLSPKVIVKPCRGVASDRVTLCHTLDDVATATRQIVNTTKFGTYHTVYDAALMQDYVDGVEYAVDVVSSQGIHKTTALWMYEKTSTDGDGQSNPFAYLCGKLVSSDDPTHPHADAVMEYVDACLTALNVQWGMSHTEVKVSSEGSIRLMEVNVRQQNDHFAPICSICIGYNALDVCLAAYLSNDNNDNDESESDCNLFLQIPRRPVLLRQGMIVNLACFVEGEIVNIHHLEDFSSLDSFVAMEMFPGFEIGNTVQRTKDIRSDCGWVHLINEDYESLMRDYESIRKRMPTMFEIR
jgi:hypothetical protein